MDNYNEEYTEISLVDIVALCFRKFVTLLICALIGTALVLGYHIVSANSEKSKAAYEVSLQKYNAQLQAAEDNLEYLQVRKAELLKRNAENPISTYESEPTYRSELVFVVTSDEEPLVAMDGTRVYNTVVSINSFWNTLDLPHLVDSQSKNEYIRQFIKFENVSVSVNGFVFRITAYSARNAEQADNYTQKVYEALSDYIKTISVVKTCTIQSTHNEAYTGSLFIDIVNRQLSEIAEIDSKIFEQMDSIKDLKKEAPSQYHYAKYAVIGFLAGGFVSLMVLVVGFVSSNPLTSTEDAKRRIKAPVLGAMFCEKDALNKIARNVMGERVFKDEASAISWLENNLDSSVLPDKAKVAILYSGKDAKAKQTFEAVNKVFTDKGYSVSFSDEVTVNPNAMTAIQNSDVVVLFEKQWTSKWKNIKAETDLAERYGKKVAGFIIC